MKGAVKMPGADDLAQALQRRGNEKKQEHDGNESKEEDDPEALLNELKNL